MKEKAAAKRVVQRREINLSVAKKKFGKILAVFHSHPIRDDGVATGVDGKDKNDAGNSLNF